MMQPTVALACFDSPLLVDWQSVQIESMTASERMRLARIQRPLRRDQFIVGHALLRRLLTVLGVDNPAIDVAADGRALVQRAECHVSIAHSGRTVAAVAAPVPVGIDLEANRVFDDPRAAAAWLGLRDDPGAGSEHVLTAWVGAEAEFKANGRTVATVWRAQWQDCFLAVAGVATKPQTLVFDSMTGTYNRAELDWDIVESAARQQG